MSSLLKKGVDAIIRPPRKDYNLEKMPLVLECADKKYIRQPLSFVNPRNQVIVGSLYHSIDSNPMSGGSCLCYLHGNSSCQLEGQFLVPNFCDYGIFVFCFDFAGCGRSGGEYISLGYFEKEDVEFLFSALFRMFNINKFVIWGRSMGAATSLLVKSPYVAGIICDSSFTSIPDMCRAIASSMNFPKAFVRLVIWVLKQKIIKIANFNLDDVSPLVSVQSMTTPVIFGHAEDDEFIPFQHAIELYTACKSDEKFIMPLTKGHNGTRAKSWIRLCIQFTLDKLGIPCTQLPEVKYLRLHSSDFHFSSFNDMFKSKKNEGNSADLGSDFDSRIRHAEEEDELESSTIVPVNKKKKIKSNSNNNNNEKDYEYEYEYVEEEVEEEEEVLEHENANAQSGTLSAQNENINANAQNEENVNEQNDQSNVTQSENANIQNEENVNEQNDQSNVTQSENANIQNEENVNVQIDQSNVTQSENANVQNEENVNVQIDQSNVTQSENANVQNEENVNVQIDQSNVTQSENANVQNEENVNVQIDQSNVTQSENTNVQNEENVNEQSGTTPSENTQNGNEDERDEAIAQDRAVSAQDGSETQQQNENESEHSNELTQTVNEFENSNTQNINETEHPEEENANAQTEDETEQSEANANTVG
ncbi:Clan SC, family S9, unassigned serine peptidase [Histomonas meleagridis]|uniref:Clan SC, family S9, unassigned serine peptidase n=1 Tax=Histomonas meleagridis TaxID=135588 RepID=UPI0035599C4B|nr:Clan SC, family S9, unassigned serine peptidase [Histomonas meleagridis]KAH0802731.1 Clan SC, family S9, unassigned serine peptidase [Histomonas meleagridis]